MKPKLTCLGLVLAGLFTLVLGAQNEELKARFLQRKPQLDEMKNQGWIGETNAGFLQLRSGDPQAQAGAAVVNAENADRQTVYAEIAARLAITPAEVGKRRALQIAQQAAAGQWLQDAAGNWYQKT